MAKVVRVRYRKGVLGKLDNQVLHLCLYPMTNPDDDVNSLIALTRLLDVIKLCYSK